VNRQHLIDVPSAHARLHGQAKELNQVIGVQPEDCCAKDLVGVAVN
jgi:hypothetical protein